MAEIEVGVIQHYFSNIGVAALEITNGEVAVGDTIHIKGHTTDLSTTIDSMQIEHETVPKAKKGDAIGIRVTEKVREHDKVFKVTE